MSPGRTAARRLRSLIALSIGLSVAGGLVALKGFTWLQGLLVGAAVAALTYSVFRTADNLRDIYRG